MSLMLTVEQVADRYQVAPKTIRQWARDGRIVGAQKIGQLWRFDAEVLEILPVGPQRPAIELVQPMARPTSKAARPDSGRAALRRALANPDRRRAA